MGIHKFDYTYDYYDKILQYVPYNIYTIYKLKLIGYVEDIIKIKINGYDEDEIYPLSFLKTEIDISDVKLTLFDVCFLSSFINIKESVDEIFNPFINSSFINSSLMSYYHVSKTVFLNIYENFYKPYLSIIENKSLLKEENIKIEGNKLIINNYYGKVIDLSKYIPTNKIKIIKKGKLIDKLNTDIDEVHIIDSNIETITSNINIKKIKLYNCINFKEINKRLLYSVKNFYIDNNKIQLIK